jgi:hypothetical protein
MSEETVVTETPTETRIKTVSVKISRQVDLGYVPYVRYLKELGNKPVPFGSRDQSRTEFDVFVSAEVGSEDTLENVIAMLASKAREFSNKFLRENFPSAFAEAAKMAVPEEAFVISQTTVERSKQGDW